jgi:preprotein translocase subunit YajC
MSTLLLPLLLVLMIGMLYLGTRKQKRQAAQQQDMQKSLSTGDKVMTTSGLYGTVVRTGDDSIDIEIAPGITTTWLRAAVREKVADTVDEDVYDDESNEAEDVDGTETDAAEYTSNGHEPSSTAELAPPLDHRK